MIAILLCAGFAVRMGPLAETVPKPLLPVAGRPILDYFLDQLRSLPHLRRIHIIANHRFHDHFQAWAKNWLPVFKKMGASIAVHDDGAVDNEHRRGAVGDLLFILERIQPGSGIVVSAGDNIYRFALEPLWNRFFHSSDHWAMALQETNTERLRRTGNLVLDPDGRVGRLLEKPVAPVSGWACPPLYFLQPSATQHLRAYVGSLEGMPDALGGFLDFLCRQETVWALKMKAERLDIGDMAAYQAAQRSLSRGPLFLPAVYI